MSDPAILHLLQQVAKEEGCLLLPVGCVRKLVVSYVVDERTTNAFGQMGEERLAHYVQSRLGEALASELRKVATQERRPSPWPMGTRHSMYLTPVDVPTYLRWADSNGLKPFLTPHGFNFNFNPI